MLRQTMFFNLLRTRQRQAEWMDDPQADPVQLHKSLLFIQRINRAFGYSRLILRHLENFSHHWNPGQTTHILDVGTGSADIPLAILRWADELQLSLRVVGLDLSAEVARIAAAQANDPRLQIVRGDALSLPFPDGSFDYVISSMFLHHLDDADAQQALAEMGRVARRGVVVSDLLRRLHAYWGIRLLTLFSNPMVKHDAAVSVAQAFNEEEIVRLRNKAGIGFARYYSYYGHRFVLAGERAVKTS